MDHILVVGAAVDGSGTSRRPIRFRKETNYQYFTVTATAPGKTV